jgi:hypothetical protein
MDEYIPIMIDISNHTRQTLIVTAITSVLSTLFAKIYVTSFLRVATVHVVVRFASRILKRNPATLHQALQLVCDVYLLLFWTEVLAILYVILVCCDLHSALRARRGSGSWSVIHGAFTISAKHMSTDPSSVAQRILALVRGWPHARSIRTASRSFTWPLGARHARQAHSQTLLVCQATLYILALRGTILVVCQGVLSTLLAVCAVWYNRRKGTNAGSLKALSPRA